MNAEEEDDDDDDVILMEETSPPINQQRTWQKKKVKDKPLLTSLYHQMWFLPPQERREKWLAAGKKAIDNLTLPKAIRALSPQEKTALKEKAQLEGEDYIELPAKVVFTIKPEKYKIGIVACGNKTKDTYGKITTTDLDTCMLRFIVGSFIKIQHHCLPRCHRCVLKCRSSSRKSCSPETTYSVVQAWSHLNWLCVESTQSSLWP